MEELLRHLDEEFDDSEGFIRIVNARWLDDGLRLSMSLRLNEDADPELWEVSCAWVVEESLSAEYACHVRVDEDSPLLKPYAESQVELMFSGNECPPALLLGVVASCCTDVMGRPQYLQRFLNQQAVASGIVSSRYGLLGRFPESIAARIVTALSGQPIRIRSLPTGMPKRWTGTEIIPYPKLAVLSIGESYVIAESFSATRA
jgi:hypothetical protein